MITTGIDKDEGTLPWYESMYSQCKIDDGYELAVAHDAMLVASGKARYEAVSKLTGIPWFVIAIIHFKEGSCNFKACLANGERIIGTGKKTTLVPKDRGPYTTWEDGALDALTLKKFDKVKDWSIGNMLSIVERYNGKGYINGAGKQETSPYLWARTNINDGLGKYTSDGKFSPSQSTNRTSGFCAILKHLEISGQLSAGVIA